MRWIINEDICVMATLFVRNHWTSIQCDKVPAAIRLLPAASQSCHVNSRMGAPAINIGFIATAPSRFAITKAWFGVYRVDISEQTVELL